jgi:transcriptional regulator with XRE-family HTH domain
METSNELEHVAFWERCRKLCGSGRLMAEAAGVAESSISEWQQKGKFPRLDQAYSLAHKSGSSLAYLTGETDIGSDEEEILSVYRMLDMDKRRKFWKMTQMMKEQLLKFQKSEDSRPIEFEFMQPCEI